MKIALVCVGVATCTASDGVFYLKSGRGYCLTALGSGSADELFSFVATRPCASLSTQQWTYDAQGDQQLCSTALGCLRKTKHSYGTEQESPYIALMPQAASDYCNQPESQECWHKLGALAYNPVSLALYVQGHCDWVLDCADGILPTYIDTHERSYSNCTYTNPEQQWSFIPA
jgi:hypothetical protein